MYKKLSFLAIVFVLVLAVLACGGEAAEPLPENILFQDDFSDTSSGWDRVNVSEGITDYVDGQYRIFVNTTGTDVWANPGLSFTDVIVEVDAAKMTGPDDNDFGLICRSQDVENFYQFIISSDGYYGIAKVVGGTQELIGETDLLPDDAIKQGNVTNRIQAKCIGSKLTLSVNGTQVASFDDTAFTSGDVGLFAGTFSEAGTDVHFDNFVVMKP
jgi:hypothetical protein